MKLLKAKEVAELLNISKQTVYKLEREGILRSIILRNNKYRTLRFFYDDVIKLINQNKEIEVVNK